MPIRPLSLLLFIVFFDASSAQTNDVIVLGKDWHIHALEIQAHLFPLQSAQQQQNYHSAIIRQFEERYDLVKQDTGKIAVYEVQGGSVDINFGLLFKPFISKTGILHSLEIGHRFGISQPFYKIKWHDTVALDGISFRSYIYQVYWFYNPTIALSSEVFLNRVKATIGIEGFLYRQRTNSYDLYIDNIYRLYDSPTVSITNDFTHDLSISKLGLGYNIGFKVFLSCRWNVSVAFRHQLIRESNGNQIHKYNNQHIGLGLRYKFGVNHLSDKERAHPQKTVFW